MIVKEFAIKLPTLHPKQVEFIRSTAKRKVIREPDSWAADSKRAKDCYLYLIIRNDSI